MEYDDERLLNEIAEIKRDLTAVKTDVAFIKGQMAGGVYKGAPIQSPTTQSFIETATSKQGIFYMAFATVMAWLSSYFAGLMGGK